MRSAALSHLARQSARTSAQTAALPAPGFLKDEHGIPAGDNGVYWSISHKAEVVAGVVSTRRVGIDIEVCKPVTQRLFKRVVRPDESRLFHTGDTQTVFFRVFTAKEAVLKHAGKGLRELSRLRVTSVTGACSLCVAYCHCNYVVEHFSVGRYLASVTAPSGHVRWKFVAAKT